MDALEKYAAKQKLAGHMMHSMMGMNEDAHMLCKVLDKTAAMAVSLKKKIAMGHKLPSWAEYKVYKAGDSIKSAMSSTFSMRDHMPKLTIAIKSAPMMKQAMMGNSPLAQQMNQGSGLPGYDKGGPVKKDGFLTDKQGKPYARVHAGEKVVPKEGNAVEKLVELIDTLMGAKKDAEKFDRGNSRAGVRLRKAATEASRELKALRAAVQNIKRSRKEGN
tara:strand:- start:534 stop:1187 length:654 start_codon:yes stop_codon:yes gene_type:complete